MAEAPGPGPRPGSGTAELDHRRRPRRRGQELFDAVFDAVLAELAESGYGSLTVDGVASRAKVSKASLYRRWPGKRDLVLAAVAAALPDPDALADTGSLRDDLLLFFGQVAAHLQGPAGPALRGILGDVLGDPTSAAELYSASHRGRSAQQLRSVLQRAVGRGELSADRLAAVSARQLEAGPAILRHHYLWEGVIGDQLCAEIVDEVVLPLLSPVATAPGTAPPATGPLSAPTPTIVPPTTLPTTPTPATKEHPMQISRLDHLVLTVADVERTVAWYERVLGMQAVTFGDGRRALLFGQQKINLHLVGHEFEPKAEHPTRGSADLCLITPLPVDEVQQHLASVGVPVELGPVARTGATGAITSLYLRDPDGNLVEVSRYDDAG